MLGFLLAVLLSLHVGGERRVYVDLVEVNTFSVDGQRQVILWRWHSQEPVRGHRVAQWWVIDADPVVFHCGDYVRITSRGQTVYTKTIISTDTRGKVDPEVNDRDTLPAEYRIAYLPDPGWSHNPNP